MAYQDRILQPSQTVDSICRRSTDHREREERRKYGQRRGERRSALRRKSRVAEVMVERLGAVGDIRRQL